MAFDPSELFRPYNTKSNCKQVLLCVPLNKQMNKKFRTYTKTFVNCFLFAKCFLFWFLKLPLKCSKEKNKNTNIDVKLLLNYI